MSDAAISADGLAAGYGSGPPAITGVSFAIGEGTIAAVLGPNGGGKTTLLRALLGELRQAAGSARLASAPAYVPQGGHARLDLPLSAYDVALMGAYGRTPWHRRIAREDRRLAAEALARVGLGGRERQQFGELSGGQRQRALIARALVQQARILLLDEPFAGVDAPSEEAILALLRDLRGEGRTLLMTTHDIEQASSMDAVLCISGRQVAFGPPAEVLVPATLQATYGHEIVLLDGGTRAIAVGHHHHG